MTDRTVHVAAEDLAVLRQAATDYAERLQEYLDENLAASDRERDETAGRLAEIVGALNRTDSPTGGIFETFAWLVSARLPDGVTARAWAWDTAPPEDWSIPCYVTVDDDRYEDAVCDLGSEASLDDQAAFVADQIAGRTP